MSSWKDIEQFYNNFLSVVASLLDANKSASQAKNCHHASNGQGLTSLGRGSRCSNCRNGALSLTKDRISRSICESIPISTRNALLALNQNENIRRTACQSCGIAEITILIHIRVAPNYLRCSIEVSIRIVQQCISLIMGNPVAIICGIKANSLMRVSTHYCVIIHTNYPFDSNTITKCLMYCLLGLLVLRGINTRLVNRVLFAILEAPYMLASPAMIIRSIINRKTRIWLKATKIRIRAVLCADSHAKRHSQGKT